MAGIYEQIGQKIRELRQSFPGGSLSQEGLATKLGKPANTVSRWETGTYKPTPEDLDNIARLFAVPITVFFPDMAKEPPQAAMLTSALSGLNKTDLEEVIRYAQFRKARSVLEQAGKTRPKRQG